MNQQPEPRPCQVCGQPSTSVTLHYEDGESKPARVEAWCKNHEPEFGSPRSNEALTLDQPPK